MRRLGVGSGGSSDRPLRAQLVVALVLVLVLIAVPLYLWRRPSGTENATGGAAAAGSGVPVASAGVVPATAEPKPDERVKLAPVQRVKCAASASVTGQEGGLCDRLPFFEEALAKAVRENLGCAPKMGQEGTINYVLTIDFNHKTLHVFPGASGSWKGPQARRATQCVKRALPQPQWDSITHQYRYYQIAIMTTYKMESSVPAPAGTPTFE